MGLTHRSPARALWAGLALSSCLAGSAMGGERPKAVSGPVTSASAPAREQAPVTPPLTELLAKLPSTPTEGRGSTVHVFFSVDMASVPGLVPSKLLDRLDASLAGVDDSARGILEWMRLPPQPCADGDAGSCPAGLQAFWLGPESKLDAHDHALMRAVIAFKRSFAPGPDQETTEARAQRQEPLWREAHEQLAIALGRPKVRGLAHALWVALSQWAGSPLAQQGVARWLSSPYGGHAVWGSDSMASMVRVWPASSSVQSAPASSADGATEARPAPAEVIEQWRALVLGGEWLRGDTEQARVAALDVLMAVEAVEHGMFARNPAAFWFPHSWEGFKRSLAIFESEVSRKPGGLVRQLSWGLRSSVLKVACRLAPKEELSEVLAWYGRQPRSAADDIRWRSVLGREMPLCEEKMGGSLPPLEQIGDTP